MDLTVTDLLNQHEQVLQELRQRNIIRTNNGPWADYAELLIARYFSTSLERNSTKSADVVTPDGRRIQVKCRVLRNGTPGERELSAVRSFEFDLLAVVLFARGPTGTLVHRAVLVPVEVAQARGRYRKHTNAHSLIATDALLDASGVEDITAGLKRVAAQIDAGPQTPGT